MQVCPTYSHARDCSRRATVCYGCRRRQTTACVSARPLMRRRRSRPRRICRPPGTRCRCAPLTRMHATAVVALPCAMVAAGGNGTPACQRDHSCGEGGAGREGSAGRAGRVAGVPPTTSHARDCSRRPRAHWPQLKCAWRAPPVVVGAQFRRAGIEGRCPSGSAFSCSSDQHGPSASFSCGVRNLPPATIRRPQSQPSMPTALRRSQHLPQINWALHPDA